MVNKVKASKFLLAKEKSFKNQTHVLMSVLSSCLLCCKLKWVCDLEIPLMHHNDGQQTNEMFQSLQQQKHHNSQTATNFHESRVDVKMHELL